MLQKPAPILVADRFPALLGALLDLLESLSGEDWQRLVHGEWTVKDLAQHLLGDEINILSGKRDGYRENVGPIVSWEELVAFINRRNAVWVEATRRMSPRLICDLLHSTGEQANTYFQALEMFAMGGPVNWAGPDPAPVWLDVAREFTERWHHQQHIRQAVGKPGAMEPYFLAPVLAAFVYALPIALRDTPAPEGTGLALVITGAAGGAWTALREHERWQLYSGEPDHPKAVAELPQDIAWQLFTKGISREAARRQAQFSGDISLAKKVLEMVSIIA
jgi:uncharacterized protein (TIGR03083 family)